MNEKITWTEVTDRGSRYWVMLGSGTELCRIIGGNGQWLWIPARILNSYSFMITGKNLDDAKEYARAYAFYAVRQMDERVHKLLTLFD